MSLADHLDCWPIILPPQATVSLEGFCAWTRSPEFPERGKVSYINGEVILDMSPERPETHVKVKTRVSSVLDTLVQEHKLGSFYGDGSMLINKKAGLSTEPDAMFVSWKTLESGLLKGDAGSLQESVNLIGTPDWVLEVVSPSSVRKDKVLLKEQYFKAGIPEYWLIDALGEEIEFTLLVRGDEGYVPAEPTDGWRFSPVFNRSFQLTRELDQAGLWQYTLAVRE